MTNATNGTGNAAATLTPEQAAAILAKSGFSFVPGKIDGSKRPSIDTWKEFQARKPTPEEITGWYGGGKTRAICIIHGEISGNLETLDFDKIELWKPFCRAVMAQAPGLLERLLIVETPRPGRQVTYRCRQIGRNRKLAWAERLATEEEKATQAAYQNEGGEWVVKVATIETRGEGGYTIGVGSPLRTHATGRPYTFRNLDYEHVPSITVEERELLFSICESLSEIPLPEEARDEATEKRKRERKPGDPILPGDDYGERADHAAELERWGWTRSGESRYGSLWTRPGKDARNGVSATLFPNGNLYVFSSNAHPLPHEKAVTPFARYAFYDHKGDFKAAARALGKAGYGGDSVNSGNSVQTEQAPEEWEMPAPFGEYDLPAFPLDALPAWLRSYVSGLAVESQTPPDLAAALTLANCSSALAGRVVVRVREGWTEPTNTYWLSVIGVGNRKTAVHDAAKEPLEEVERDLIRDIQEEIDSAKLERSTLEHCLEELKRKAAKAKTKEERDDFIARVKETAAEIAEIQIPVSPKLLVSGDITPEALASMLAEQGGRLFLSSDEGELFEIAAGRYGNGANIETLLKAHTGAKLRINRRGRSEIIESATLTIGMTVQPDVLRGIADSPKFRGRGLCGRFLYSMPKSLVGGRKSSPKPLADEARTEYTKRLKALAGLEKITNGDGEPAARVVKVSREGVDYLTAFMDELEPQMAEGGALHSIADWATKLTGAVVRIAAVLHYADNAYSLNTIAEIPAVVIRRAISIGRYLIPHALAAYAEMGADPQIENAKHLLRWIRKAGLAQFTKREAHRENQGRFKKVTDIEPALELLEAHGYVRAIAKASEPGRPGRKASQLFDVNPATFAEISTSLPTDRIDTIDTITPDAPESGNSVNSVNSVSEVENPKNAEPSGDDLLEDLARDVDVYVSGLSSPAARQWGEV